MRRLVVALAAVTLLATACGGGEEPAGARPSTPVQVSIVQPEPGATVTGKQFPIEFSLSNGGKIVDEVTTNLEPVTEGHVHLSIDGEVVSQTFATKRNVDTPTKAGQHIIQVEFVAKDHGPFNPRVIASAPIEVQP